MRRTSPLLSAAALALCLALSAGPLLASDFYTPSPVPSGRDNIKPTAKGAKKTSNLGNLNAGNKIVKSTKGADGTSQPTAAKKPASIQ